MKRWEESLVTYLRNGGHEARSHADRPQALTSSREISGGEHRELRRIVPVGGAKGGEGIDGGGVKGTEEEEKDEKNQLSAAPHRSERSRDQVI